MDEYFSILFKIHSNSILRNKCKNSYNLVRRYLFMKYFKKSRGYN